MPKTSSAKQTEEIVKYAPYTLEDAEEDKRDIENTGGTNIFAKLKEGKNKFRFLPPLPGRKWRRVTFVHYIDIPGGDRASIVCPRIEAKRACVICEKEKHLWEHSDELESKGKVAAAEADRKVAKKLRAKRRAYANVIDRNNPESGPMVLGFGTMIEESLVELRKDEEEGGDFTNPGPEGFDIIINRSGTGQFDTKYETKRSKVECALAEDVQQLNTWIKNQHNLERFCKVMSDSDIAKVLRGEKPGDDDEDEAPRKPNSQQRTVQSAVDDAEIEDEEIEIDEDDE